MKQQNKDKKIMIRLTPNHEQIVREEAERATEPISTFVRRVLMEQIRKMRKTRK